MPLAEPPDRAGSLADVPAEPVSGRRLHRVWRLDGSGDPWWYASVPDDDDDPGGRWDLPAPMGTCYTATSAVGAVLEALQAHLVNLPRAELRTRRRAQIDAPPDAPDAADVTDRQLAGRGVTASLWAGVDRALTQRWAAAFRRDGWWALHGGIQHDPSARLRAVALFDTAGAHPPTTGSGWAYTTATLHDDGDLAGELDRFGVTVRDPGVLPYADPPDG